MNPIVKRTLLGLALFSTIIFVWFSPAVDDDDIALSDRVKTIVKPPRNVSSATKNPYDKSSASAAVSMPVTVLSIRSRSQNEEMDVQDSRLFTSTQWTTPLIQKTAVPPINPIEKIKTVDETPVNQAPPALPFVVLGRYIEAGHEVIFLQHNNQNLVVRVGDTLLEQYKVESLQGSTLNLRYLPLNLAQSLEIGSKQ